MQANATEASVYALENKLAASKFAEGILAEPDPDENWAAFEDAWQKNMRASNASTDASYQSLEALMASVWVLHAL